GHHACELRDVTLLGRLDEDPLHAELPQPGCNGLAALRIPVDSGHVPTLFVLRACSRWVEERAAFPGVQNVCALDELRYPRADRLPISPQATAQNLARLYVQRVEGDGRPVHIKPSEDRHQGPAL